MVDLLKRSIFATIGIAHMTKEKVEEIGKKIAAEAKLSETEGKQFIDELLKRSDDTRQQLEQLISRHVAKALKKVNCASQQEVEALEKRIRALETNASQGAE